jgi:hypothetical protein
LVAVIFILFRLLLVAPTKLLHVRRSLADACTTQQPLLLFTLRAPTVPGHFVCDMPRRFLNLFALDPSMRCNSAIDASALKHVKLLIIDFSCYITSWVLLQDVLFELLECCVHRFSDLVLLIPVLLFCDSTNSMMLPNKYEFCCCLLLDACALASCQNTDFSCRIVA